jgi:CubicO group peptidase (beta-lactamase class C family)
LLRRVRRCVRRPCCRQLHGVAIPADGKQEPWWEPGTAAGNHGFNQGHLVGEVVHRITGKRLRDFLADEVMGPLGVATDYCIGTPEERDPWVSRLIQSFSTEPLATQCSIAPC